jgi:hypothetical protein
MGQENYTRTMVYFAQFAMSRRKYFQFDFFFRLGDYLAAASASAAIQRHRTTTVKKHMPSYANSSIGILHHPGKRTAPFAALIAVLSALLAGCLSFVDTVDPGDAPDPGMAYIAGSFTMSNYFRKNVVISLRNLDTGSARMIKLRGYTDRTVPGEITAIEVEPGRYAFDEMLACPAVRALFTLEKMDCTARRPFACESCVKQSAVFTVEKGKVYYPGSFSGISYGTDGGKNIAWEVQVADEGIDAVAAKFRERFTKFAALPFVPAFP